MIDKSIITRLHLNSIQLTLRRKMNKPGKAKWRHIKVLSKSKICSINQCSRLTHRIKSKENDLIIHDFEGDVGTGAHALHQTLQRLLARLNGGGKATLEKTVVEDDIDARLPTEPYQGIGRQALRAVD